MEIKNAKKIHKKGDKNQVIPLFGSRIVFDVISGTSGEKYAVTRNADGGAICNCPWGRKSQKKGTKMQSACNHVQSVFEWLEAEKSRRSSAWSNQTDADRQHRPIENIGDGVILTSRIKS